MTYEIGIDSVQGPYSRIHYEKINLGSHDQVKKYLLSVGWKPTQYNKKFDKETRKWRVTSPKLTEDSFDSIKDDTGKLLARRNIIVHRRRAIQNYDDPENKGILSCIRDDNRCPAEGITCNTNTTRTTHRKACCNVPKAKAKIPYGIEMRSLFCVKPPYLMLGADLDQIEARITAHFAWMFDNGEYWRVLQECGDIHQYNADLINSDRDTAKGFQYAIFFGAQPPKLAEILGCSLSDAKDYIDNFWNGNKGVGDLVIYLEKYFKKYKYIVGLDGRQLFIRAAYKLLNTLIQSAAAIVFKRWGVLLNERLIEQGVDCAQIIAYHDEFDFRCHPDHLVVATEIIKQAAIDAGLYYDMKVPITVDVKVGSCWAEVH